MTSNRLRCVVAPILRTDDFTFSATDCGVSALFPITLSYWETSSHRSATSSERHTRKADQLDSGTETDGSGLPRGTILALLGVEFFNVFVVILSIDQCVFSIVSISTQIRTQKMKILYDCTPKTAGSGASELPLLTP